MQEIPLEQVPNQRLSFNIGQSYWTLKVYQAINHMCIDISLNGNALVSGVRCFGGIPAIPFESLIPEGVGNFIFDVDADWELFSNSGCRLYYLNADEYAQYKSSMMGVIYA